MYIVCRNFPAKLKPEILQIINYTLLRCKWLYPNLFLFKYIYNVCLHFNVLLNNETSMTEIKTENLENLLGGNDELGPPTVEIIKTEQKKLKLLKYGGEKLVNARSRVYTSI